MLTADDGRETTVRALDKGAVDYLTKPVSAAELRTRLKAAIEGQELEKKRYWNWLLTAPQQPLVTIQGRVNNDSALLFAVDISRTVSGRDEGNLIIRQP